MFVSVKEAVDLTGMSQTTIYRLCKKRSHTKFVKKRDNKFFIEKEYLLATYPELEEENPGIRDISFERTALNTPGDGLMEFSDEQSTDLGEKIIGDISDKITERFNKAGEYNADGQGETNGKNIIHWETVIGVSVGILLITGFILILYFGLK